MRLDFQEKHSFWNNHDPPYPMIPIRLIGPHFKSADTYAFLDSGADNCLFHAKWARQIGIRLRAGRYEQFYGIGAHSFIRVYMHLIDIGIGKTKVRCDVGFSEDLGEETEDQLIGRSVVFNKMRFAFRQSILYIYSGPD